MTKEQEKAGKDVEATRESRDENEEITPEERVERKGAPGKRPHEAGEAEQVEEQIERHRGTRDTKQPNDEASMEGLPGFGGDMP